MSATAPRFIVALLIVCSLTFASAAFANFVVDGADNGSAGSLSNNSTVFLSLCWTNESDWYGNLAYNANRQNSSGSVTYHEYVSSGYAWFWQDDDVLRKTSIQRGGYSSMTSWYVQALSNGGC